MTTICIKSASNQEYFETNKNRQYTAYLTVKAEDEETAEDVWQDIMQGINEACPELQGMYVPEVEELSNGNFLYMDEVVGYQKDFDTKQDFLKALKDALKTSKKTWKSNN